MKYRDQNVLEFPFGFYFSSRAFGEMTIYIIRVFINSNDKMKVSFVFCKTPHVSSAVFSLTRSSFLFPLIGGKFHG